MQLKVTDSVFKRIAELAKSEHIDNPILRISVEGGGCSGLMYKYEFTNEILKGDFVTQQNNIRIVIDSISGQLLKGCTVNFVEELGSSYFEIKNPQATGKCGCGNSFSV